MDFSNSSVSDLKTFLQNTVNMLFPKIINLFLNGKIADGYVFTYHLHDGVSHPTTGIIDNYLCVAASDTTSSSTGNASYSTKVDLTNFSNIRLKAKINNASFVTGYFIISNDEKLSSSVKMVSFNSTTLSENTLDISSFSGEYYVGLRVNTSAGEAIMYTEYIIIE